jgi:5-formyltetrahydrofolate cyclo-ligase
MVRRHILQKRKALSKAELHQRSKLVQSRIINSSEFKNSKVIAAYFAVGSEVRTDDIMYTVLKNNHQILLLPKTEADKITFYEVSEDDFKKNKLTKGKFGIIEPAGSSNYNNNIDLLIVPGLAFDRNGYRLGYGKGYYDKFIKKNKYCFSVGLAFQFQLILNSELPHSDFDEKINAVVTEKEMLVFHHLNAS